jgi:hypothetical protein
MIKQQAAVTDCMPGCQQVNYCCSAAVAAGGDNTLVGVVTYDSAVHFYNVSKGQAVAQMLVMADVSDVYAPMSSKLLAKLSEAREQLAELLSSIPGMFAAAQGPECCGTAAIEVRGRHRGLGVFAWRHGAAVWLMVRCGAVKQCIDASLGQLPNSLFKHAWWS